MDKQLQAFNFGENKVRTVLQNGDVWFVAKDVAEVLEYTDAEALTRHLDEEEKQNLQLVGFKRGAIVINESGLYSAILKSRKQEAKQFKKWVTNEVLPIIRKTGMYVTDNVWEQINNDPARFGELLIQYGEAKKELEEKTKTIHILMHVNKTYTSTEIAKELGFKSATALNKDLGEKKIQFKQNGTWVLFSKYADKGYVDIKQEVLDNGRVIYHRRWTQTGREFLVKLYGGIAA